LSATVETWTCPRCGAVNKPSWRFCTGCEAMPDGSQRADYVPPRPRDPDKAVLPGLVLVAVLAALAVGAVVYGEVAWETVAALVG
jgi:hypothetical protein